jgi:hypothetical protein
MARFIPLWTILLTLTGLRLNAIDAPAESGREAHKPAEEPAKERGPALQGRITDEAGRPHRGAKVNLCGETDAAFHDVTAVEFSSGIIAIPHV